MRQLSLCEDKQKFVALFVQGGQSSNDDAGDVSTAVKQHADDGRDSVDTRKRSAALLT